MSRASIRHEKRVSGEMSLRASGVVIDTRDGHTTCPPYTYHILIRQMAIYYATTTCRHAAITLLFSRAAQRHERYERCIYDTMSLLRQLARLRERRHFVICYERNSDGQTFVDEMALAPTDSAEPDIYYGAMP